MRSRALPIALALASLAAACSQPDTRSERAARLFVEQFWTTGKLNATSDMIAPGFVHHDNSLERGWQEEQEYVAARLAAFPDLHFTVESTTSDAKRAVVCWRWTGTQDGPWCGVPGSGRHVDVSGTSTFVVVNGLLAEVCSTWDTFPYGPLGTVQRPASAEVTEEDYEVYSRALDTLFAPSGPKVVHVADRTDLDDIVAPDLATSRNLLIARACPQLPFQVLESFIARNIVPTRLDNRFAGQLEVRTISDSDRKFPYPGIVTLSKIGYDEGHRNALLFVSYWCDVLCGGGSYVWLERPKDRWQPKQEVLAWIS